MQKITSAFSVLMLSIFILIGCSKEASIDINPQAQFEQQSEKEKLSMTIFGNKDFSWNKNDSNYLNALKRYSRNINLNGDKKFVDVKKFNSCNLNGGDSTYGWYSDPDSIIIEGPISSAKNETYETWATNCPDIIASAEEANLYLIREGYSDLADMYYGSLRPGHRYLAIHAANALVELKSEFQVDYSLQAQAKIFNCILQAVGYTALAELGSNWATMSRQRIIKAVGKLASKHLSWFGAVIAVGSFIDCMWG